MIASRRRAGILVPLFSVPSSASWGIGDIRDVAQTASWLAASGQRVMQLLPLNEMASGQQSPYSALSAMAIDPLYISVPHAIEMVGIDGDLGLDEAWHASLAQAQACRDVDYAAVRRLKRTALEKLYERFCDLDVQRTDRRFATFVAAEAWWLDDYLLFRALHDREGSVAWQEWPEPLARRDPDALTAARRELVRETTFYAFLQWLSGEQWRAAHAAAAACGVAIFGDLPFMVDADSADVWAHQDQFHLDISVGAPPDAFSDEGQDWGAPMYRWDAMAADDFQWLRKRTRRIAALFDGFRIDHLVGFYRTYGRPRKGGPPFFSPAEETEQIRLGEAVLEIFAASGAEIYAEDLGTVPDYVRESLAGLGIPGLRVLRWERHWHTPGKPFRDPASFPVVSVAASGTHDTEPLATWWEHAPPEDQELVSELETVQQLTGGSDLVDASYEPLVRDTLLEALYASGSALALAVIQDVFGWRDRINEPATVTDTNWTFRLPWPSDQLDQTPEARDRQASLRAWSEKYKRS